MELKAIHADGAPAAIGPYAQAIRAGEFLFTSGQIPMDPVTGDIVGDEIEVQTRRVFDNLQAVLAAAHLDLSHVVKANVYLTDMEDFPGLNAVYAEYFGAHKPARATVQVARLPRDVRVEIDLVACG